MLQPAKTLLMPEDKKSCHIPCRWSKFVSPIQEAGLHYAMVLGNHDTEAELTGRELVLLDMQHPLSLTQLGPQDLPGASNYILNIYPHQAARPYVLTSASQVGMQIKATVWLPHTACPVPVHMQLKDPTCSKAW